MSHAVAQSAVAACCRASSLRRSLLLPCFGVWPSKSQWSVFEDHTALVKSGDEVRAKTLDEIKNELGADTLRIEVKWSEVAPEPGAKTKPRLQRERSARLRVRPGRVSRAGTRTTTSCGARPTSASGSS